MARSTNVSITRKANVFYIDRQIYYAIFSDYVDSIFIMTASDTAQFALHKCHKLYIIFNDYEYCKLMIDVHFRNLKNLTAYQKM